ncbi:MAG TPA: hypothetical protein VFZ59_16030 [Verrucomicrobiae bacterium]|nr:hypothetical protein [Verrucomicrobiae bacterium]
MKEFKTQAGILFLMGFAASTISGGAPMVLLILMAIVAIVAVAVMHFEPEIKLPALTLRSPWKHQEEATPQSALVLGLGHQVKR